MGEILPEASIVLGVYFLRYIYLLWAECRYLLLGYNGRHPVLYILRFIRCGGTTFSRCLQILLEPQLLFLSMSICKEVWGLTECCQGVLRPRVCRFTTPYASKYHLEHFRAVILAIRLYNGLNWTCRDSMWTCPPPDMWNDWYQLSRLFTKMK